MNQCNGNVQWFVKLHTIEYCMIQENLEPGGGGTSI